MCIKIHVEQVHIVQDALLVCQQYKSLKCKKLKSHKTFHVYNVILINGHGCTSPPLFLWGGGGGLSRLCIKLQIPIKEQIISKTSNWK